MCGYNRDTRHGLYFHIRRFHALPESLPAGNSDIPIAEWESMETARDALNVSKSRSEDRNEVDVKGGLLHIYSNIPLQSTSGKLIKNFR